MAEYTPGKKLYLVEFEMTNIVMLLCECPGPNCGRALLMSPPCLESQGCHLIPSFYLLPCYSAYSPVAHSVSQPTCPLLAHSPDLFFSLNLHFPKGRLFCLALVFFCLLERLGDEQGLAYFSQWYVQHMPPYQPLCNYIVFLIRDFFLPILFNIKKIQY